MSPRILLGRQHLLSILIAAAASAGFAGAAIAHPHVWATVHSEIVFGPDHRITGIRHHWTFDEFYTAMAVQGLDTNGDGVYSKEELQPLAQVNVELLKDFDYFTFVHLSDDDKPLPLKEPVDYSVDYDKTLLTLHFTLPLEKPLDPKVHDGYARDPITAQGICDAFHDAERCTPPSTTRSAGVARLWRRRWLTATKPASSRGPSHPSVHDGPPSPPGRPDGRYSLGPVAALGQPPLSQAVGAVASRVDSHHGPERLDIGRGWGVLRGDSLGWHGAISGGVVFDCPAVDTGAERFEDGHGLADQARDGLVVPLRTVENGDVGSGQTVAGAPNHFGKHGDELLVEGDPVVRRGGFGPYPRGPGFGRGEDLDPLGLGLRRADHLSKSCCWRSSALRSATFACSARTSCCARAAANGPD